MPGLGWYFYQMFQASINKATGGAKVLVTEGLPFGSLVQKF